MSEPSLTDLHPRLRALLARILTGTDGFGAPVLREQLALARARGAGEAAADELPGFVDLVVETADETASVGRVVPHRFTFPVRAEFDHDGTTYGLSIGVEDGRLSSVTLAPVEPQAAETETWPATWPGDVSLRHETSS